MTKLLHGLGRPRAHLILKITLPTLVLVLGLSLASTLVLGRMFAHIHEGGAERRAARFSSIVEDAFRRDVERGHAGVAPFMKVLCEAAHKSAAVMNRDGLVLFACNDALVGTIADHRPGGGQSVRHGGIRWDRWVQPIDRDPACAGCHHQEGTIGYLGVDVPMEEADKEVAQHRRMGLVATTILTLILSALLVLVHLVLVYWPIRRLTGAVERIRAGDLSVRVPAANPDEIGQLAQSLNDMAASMERAKGELARTHRTELAQSEKLAALGQLFTSVSHEIKNQLAGIVGALRVVEMEVPEDDATKPVLGKILAQMERMSQTAVTALEFARPLEPSVASVDVVDVLDRALFFIERQASEQSVILRKRYAPGLPPARMDEDLMKQVFLNILLNGVQAMPHGGTLEVETRSVGGRAIEVMISDQGVGIAPENRDRIFSPFFSTKAHGTGLGLYIARQIVETQRGEIQVESRPGQGTSFTVRLPVDAAGMEPRARVAG